jgi:hypothetical protein
MSVTGFIGRRPWLWVVAAFVVLLLAWAALITIAGKNKPAEVPMAGKPAHAAAKQGDTHGEQP